MNLPTDLHRPIHSRPPDLSGSTCLTAVAKQRALADVGPWHLASEVKYRVYPG